MVIATQNPIEQAGTYRLPEAQLDRFLMKTSLGYPDHEATVAVLARRQDPRPHQGAPAGGHLAASSPTWRSSPTRCTSTPAILDYVSRIAEESRRHVSIKLGPVGARLPGVRALRQDLGRSSQGRDHVVPDDIKLLAQPVLCHRLLAHRRGRSSPASRVEQVIDQILAEVAPPAERVA